MIEIIDWEISWSVVVRRRRRKKMKREREIGKF
jgi:hypothetical protein